MKSKTQLWLPAVCFLTIFLWYFGRTLVGPSNFVFRDAAHYYFPLFQLIQDQWASGTVPLWSQYDGLGTPILADATSSVFYPGKLIFCLPISFALAYRLYIVLHYLLAFGAAYYTAKNWQRSTTASTIAAVSYAFGGYVLCQHANVVFLIGCAWLPLALLTAQRMLNSGCWKSAIGFAMVLAMMVLGGDPQMAYHCVLLAVVYGMLITFQKSNANESAEEESSATPSPNLFKRVGLLGLSIVLALGLSAIQIGPSLSWSQHSTRSHFDQPRNVYEYLGDSSDRDNEDHLATLAGKPAAGTHERQLYEFSVGPWRWAELIWPNFYGQMYPENQRWAQAIPASGRVWSPTLYAGIIPLLLIASALGFRKKYTSSIARWLSWIVVLALLASLGWYGLGWLYIEIGYSTGLWNVDDLSIGQPFGGLYWLMTAALPKYVQFRYPAKLWSLFALAASLLAAYGWDKEAENQFVRLRWLTAITCVVSAVMLAAVYLFQNAIVESFPAQPADSLFGPWLPEAGITTGMWGILQTFCITGVAYVLLKKHEALQKMLPTLIIVIVTIDLVIASAWVVQYRPREFHDIDLTSKVNQLAPREEHSPPSRWYRDLRSTSYPPQFAKTSSASRQIDGQRWDQATLFPRYHLLQKVRNIRSVNSIANLDQETLWQAANSKRKTRELIRLLGGEYWIVDGAKPQSEQYEVLDSQSLFADTKINYLRDSQVFPPAWIVHQADVLPAANMNHRQDYQARAKEVLFTPDGFRDFHQQVVLETDELITLPEVPQGTMTPQEEAVIVGRAADVIQLEATLQSPGVLVIQEFYDPAWKAEIETLSTRDNIGAIRLQWEPVSSYRANRIMHGIPLPAGTHRVRLIYHPPEFYTGGAISLGCWFALCCLGIWVGIQKNIPQNHKNS